MTYDVPAAKFIYIEKIANFPNSLTNYNWDFGSSKGGAQEIFVKIEKMQKGHIYFEINWISNSRSRLENKFENFDIFFFFFLTFFLFFFFFNEN